MKYFTGISALLSLFLITACVSTHQQPDPAKEEVVILQKQLLELQKLQHETSIKLDESTVTVNALSMKLQTLEKRQGARSVSVNKPRIESKTITPAAGKKAPAVKKKPKKKTKKKARRQE